VFCVPAAIVGVGVFGVAVGGMAVLGGIGTVCYIAESIIETTVDTLFDITSLIYNLSTNNEIPVAAIELDECPMVESKVLEIYDTDTDTSLEGGADVRFANRSSPIILRTVRGGVIFYPLRFLQINDK